jgi:phospholipid/cholesterol/gamma-HCH transport system substrate-binding protein
VHLPDTGGLGPDAQVTYRGVSVGSVSAVSVDATGVTLTLHINAGERIPADSHAAISMDLPIDITSLDLDPANDAPPYLHNGSVLPAAAVTQPVSLETLLTEFNAVAGKLDPGDLRTLSTALATGLRGTGPDLQETLKNSATLAQFLATQQSRINHLISGTSDLLGPAAGATANLPQISAGLRQLTDQLRAQDPKVRQILGTAPAVGKQASGVISAAEPSVSALLGNLLAVGDAAGSNIPALEELLATGPGDLSKMTGIVHGGIADFDLVATQGPVCYYTTPRRSPADTAPRQPDLDQQCTPSTHLEQRGADNAPQPFGTTSAIRQSAAGGFTWPALIWQGAY